MTAQRSLLSCGPEANILILDIIPPTHPQKKSDDELCQIFHLITTQVHCPPSPATLVLWSYTTETNDVELCSVFLNASHKSL